VEMQLLLQKNKELDADKVKEFVKKCNNPRILIVYFSLEDKCILKNFFDSLAKCLQVPFIGTRVSGTFTLGDGFCDDGVAFVVLCGDFEVNIFSADINLANPSKTIEKVTPEMAGSGLCIAYSANPFKENIKVDAIFRGIQSKYPNMQIFGGISAPKPFVVNNSKIHENAIVFAMIRGLSSSFELESGFKFDEQNSEEYTITHSDEYCIYGINDKSAVEEYCRIQHMRPYFINTLAGLFPRSDMARVLKSISKLNTVIYEGVLGMCIHALGAEIEKDKAEILFAVELNEKNNQLVTQSYKANGTILKRLKTSREEQLAVYDRLQERIPRGDAVLINSCQCGLFWMDFDLKNLEQKLKKFKTPYLIAYVYGSLGAKTNQKGPKNILHAGVIKALTFK
jgi:hypothetical protein